MDFNAAILAHKRWKDRILQSIDAGNAIDPAAVARDDQCELGKWLQGATATERAFPEYRITLEHHTRFHQVAAETVRKAAALPVEQAKALLGPTSPYGVASAACVNAIAALRKKAQP